MSESSQTVTLSRADYEALLDRLEEAEDAATLDRLERRLAVAGPETALADYLPGELVQRLIAGEHPIRVWRAHRGFTREGLSAAAGLSPSYVTEIETRRKPGSFNAIAKLATALEVSLDDIAPWLNRTE
jgi:DNA-binding Xre family transcriptional regulator